MYNQEVAAGNKPALADPKNDKLPSDFVDDLKNKVDPNIVAEYETRVSRFLAL
mgnify:CR=1 FL=1